MTRRQATPFALICLLAACRQAETPPMAIRLVDLHQPAQAASPAAAPAIPRIEWRFDGPGQQPAPKGHAATHGWSAGPGQRDLAIRDGLLTGKAVDDFPLLHLERPGGIEDRDTLHSVEVRLRASAGTNLSVSWRGGGEPVDLKEVVGSGRDFPWLDRTPIVAGDQVRSYRLRVRRTTAIGDIRHLFLRPTDAAGATFAIESVRLITRREHLAGIPSGVSWQGLAEIYRETIVARSPETIRMSVTLPPRPILDLAVGTVENAPVTFRVGVAPLSAGEEAAARVLLERTLTTPHRWEEAPVDLSELAGRDVALTLTVTAEQPGSIGFWGAPVVRDRRGGPDRAEGATPTRPQGVILFWADTTRRDHLSVYGYARDTTPVLRDLAKSGALFSHCVSQATWTKVSTPSLFTSLHPSSHTVREFEDRLPASAVTLAEVYRDAGHATLSMASNLFVGAFTNVHQGFEVLYEDGSLADQESSKTSRQIADRLLPWLEAHREVPFFALLHMYDPHDPYKPRPPYDTMWADPAMAEEHERQAKAVKEFISDPLMKRFGMPTRDDLARAGFDPDAYAAYDRDWYDGSIRGMDTEIGRIIEKLRGLGLEDRVLVVVAGDHGEEFLEHGRMFHGQTVYGELTDVPLLMWGPGVIPAGIVVDDTVRIIDVMPTLLDLSGLKGPAVMQGRSLVPLLAGRSAGPGVQAAGPAQEAPGAIAEKLATKPVAGGGPPPHEIESFAIVRGGWKLIHHAVQPAGGPEYELFDVRADPLNLNDVAGAHPEIVRDLAGEIRAWSERARAARLAPDTEAAGSLSSEELERLRSLGYIQ